MEIIKCASSYGTEALLSFRNPLGKEVNWIEHSEEVDNSLLFLGRRIITQLVLPLLSLSALVESVVYPVFASGFFLANHVVEIPSFLKAQKWLDRASSARFTVIWTLGNFFIHNLFFIHVFTNESLARASLDMPDSQRGKIWRVVLVVFAASSLAAVSCALSFLALALTIHATIGTIGLGAGAKSAITFMSALIGGFTYFTYYKVELVIKGLKAQRQCDKDYRLNFLQQNPSLVPYLTGDYKPLIVSEDFFGSLKKMVNEVERKKALFEHISKDHPELQPNQIELIYGLNIITVLNEVEEVLNSPGVKCFKAHLINDPEVETTTKQAIRDAAAEVIPFLLARVGYMYVWGKEKNKSIPSFFKDRTQKKIRQLREHYKDELFDFGDKIKSIEGFNKEIVEENKRKAFNQLRLAMTEEISGKNSFLNLYWGDAIRPES